jgi:DNA-binding protein HU-beta
MTKQDVIRQVSERTGIDSLTTRSIIESFFDVVKDALVGGRPIYVRTFGSFNLKQRAPKTARNITQNITITVDAHVAPIFKPSREFIDQIRKQTIPR